MLPPITAPFIRRCCTSILFWSLSNLLLAQAGLRGRVVEAETGEPLAGVNIYFPNTNIGTVTDLDGMFKLAAPDTATQVIAAFPGYFVDTLPFDTERFMLIGLTSLPITDLPSAGCCVLFVPSIQKGNTPLIQPVSENNFAVQYPAQLLQGKVAGLTVTRIGDNPNEDFFMQLRGVSTFSQRIAPMVVVDGLPESSLYMLDPNDIASIRVLKDAASAAKWGIMGTAGVVEVETKKGADSGIPKFTYSSYMSRSNLGRTMPVVSKKDYVRLKSPSHNLGYDTDWMAGVTNDAAISHGHQLSVSAKEGSLSFYASLGLHDEEGMLRNNGFRQTNARLQLQYEPLKNRLVLSTQLSAASRAIEYSFPQVFGMATLYNPTAPIYDPQDTEHGGYFQESSNNFNPIAGIEQNVSIGVRKQLSGNLHGELRLWRQWRLESTVSLFAQKHLGGLYLSPESQFLLTFSSGRLTKTRTTTDNQRGEAALTNKWAGKGGLAITQRHGYAKHFRREYTLLERVFNSNSISRLNFDNLKDPIAQAFDEVKARRTHSFFSDWQLKKRSFFLDAHWRLDGTDLKQKAGRALFYGVTVGADFKSILNLQHFDQLVLRLGNGKTGALTNTRNEYLADIEQGGYRLYDGEFVPNYYGDDSLFTPEIKVENNLGIDFSLGNGRLAGSVDIYQNEVSDLVIVEESAIFGVVETNYGRVENAGLELGLQVKWLQNRRLTWNMGLQFFANKSILKRFSVNGPVEDEGVYGYPPFFSSANSSVQLEENKPVGQIFGFTTNGEVMNGALVIQDPDGDGIFTREVIGNGLPKAGLGCQQELHWGKFDLTIYLRSMLGHQLVNSFRLWAEPTSPYSTQNIVKTPYFKENVNYGIGFLNYHVENASFLKLDRVALGYRIPVKKGSLHLSLSAQNLWTWTKYTGLDPEPRLQNDGRSLEVGVERGDTYLRNKSWTLGLLYRL